VAGDLALELVVLDDAPFLEVDQEELPGGQAPLALDVLRGDGHDPGLRGQHHVALGVLDPASRAQSVAVEHRPSQPAVGEDDSRGPIPGLHQAGVKVVEAFDVRIEVRARPVGLGHHHHHGVRDGATSQHKELQHVVEYGRVRSTLSDDGHDLFQILAEELGGELRFARSHPVDVSAQGVDLAVVGDHPVGVGELPAREGVGREAGVSQRQP
jgi:hypothetical protein